MSDDSWVSTSAPYLTPGAEGHPDAWTEQSSAHGRQGGQRLLAVEETDAPPAIRAALRLSAAEQVVVRRRLILLDDEPIELADSYYPASVAVGTALAEARKIRGGAVRLLADLGHTCGTTTEDVNARTATAQESAVLNLSEDSAVLVLLRTVEDLSGMPYEVSVMVMPGTRRLSYRLGEQVIP
jgi:GntR family transcriptional regulator